MHSSDRLAIRKAKPNMCRVLRFKKFIKVIRVMKLLVLRV